MHKIYCAKHILDFVVVVASLSWCLSLCLVYRYLFIWDYYQYLPHCKLILPWKVCFLICFLFYLFLWLAIIMNTLHWWIYHNFVVVFVIAIVIYVHIFFVPLHVPLKISGSGMWVCCINLSHFLKLLDHYWQAQRNKTNKKPQQQKQKQTLSQYHIAYKCYKLFKTGRWGDVYSQHVMWMGLYLQINQRAASAGVVESQLLQPHWMC